MNSCYSSPSRVEELGPHQDAGLKAEAFSNDPLLETEDTQDCAFPVFSSLPAQGPRSCSCFLCKTEKETQMYRTDFWTLWEKARVGCFERTAVKHVYYLG